MRTLKSFILVAPLVFAPVDSRADIYLKNYSDWNSMGPAERSGFAGGLVEGAAMMGFDDDTLALGVGLNTCVRDLKLDTKTLSEAITRRYELEPKDWSKSPIQVFAEQIIFGACLKYINEQRAKKTLPPWPLDKGQ